MSEEPAVCAFSGLSVRECQESDVCDCFTDGVDDGTGGMGPGTPAGHWIVGRAVQDPEPGQEPARSWGSVEELADLFFGKVPSQMWHGYCGLDEAEDAWISVIAGPTPVLPEPFMDLGPGKRVVFRRTWSYEPSDAEKEDVLSPPPGWRGEDLPSADG